MKKVKNLAGKKQPNGRLTAIEQFGFDKQRNATWICRCDCGNYIILRNNSFSNEKTISCGCYLKEVLNGNTRSVKHGESSSPEYRIWSGIKDRCYREKIKSYSRYGGRGIKMCDRWKNSFEAFLEDMGRRPEKGMQIERIDNNSNYEPENCKWDTRKNQCRNTRRNIYFTIDGETRLMVEWCEHFGIDHANVRHRMNIGWSVEDAFKIPEKKTNKNNSINILFTMDGETKSIKDWCVQYGINLKTFRHRWEKIGMSTEQSIKTPLMRKFNLIV